MISLHKNSVFSTTTARARHSESGVIPDTTKVYTQRNQPEAYSRMQHASHPVLQACWP